MASKPGALIAPSELLRELGPGANTLRDDDPERRITRAESRLRRFR